MRQKSNSDSENIILDSNALRDIVQTITRIKNFDSTILIAGESGTGKSLLAKYIHQKSHRFSGSFVTINCATIPENLIESELFGYAPGAFTGASTTGKIGMVELANNGTLFLDEIGLLPLNVQSKFLQLIQDHTYTPIGSVVEKSVNIRIISATNLDLASQIKNKAFREDLYYRLRVIEFFLPALRDRIDDADALIDFFVNQYCNIYNVQKTISSKVRETLKSQPWPGNIRELQYVIERMIVTSAGNHIMISDLPSNYNARPLDHFASFESFTYKDSMNNFEYYIVNSAYEKNQSSYKLAKALSISQTKACKLLKKHNIGV